MHGRAGAAGFGSTAGHPGGTGVVRPASHLEGGRRRRRGRGGGSHQRGGAAPPRALPGRPGRDSGAEGAAGEGAKGAGRRRPRRGGGGERKVAAKADLRDRLRRVLFLVPYAVRHPGIPVRDLARSAACRRSRSSRTSTVLPSRRTTSSTSTSRGTRSTWRSTRASPGRRDSRRVKQRRWWRGEGRSEARGGSGWSGRCGTPFPGTGAPSRGRAGPWERRPAAPGPPAPAPRLRAPWPRPPAPLLHSP